VVGAFHFEGQETDDEVYGPENAVSYQYRVHDPRLGRFLSLDPLAPEYPFYSPYAFSGNRVIDAVELEGLEPSFTQTPIEVRPELGMTSVAPDGTLVNSDGVPVDFYDVGDEVIAERTKPSLSPGFRALGLFAFFMSIDISSNSRGSTTEERRRIDDERRREEGKVDFALGLGALKMEGLVDKPDPMSNLLMWAGFFLRSQDETADTYWDRPTFTNDPRVNVLHMMNETIAQGNKLHFRLDGLGLTGLDGLQEEDTWKDLPKTIQELRGRLNTQGRSGGSYTIYELQQVMSNPTYLENTQFWLNNQRISTEHVKELLGEITPPSE
jgi:RHS repeat-associated protein